MSETEERLKELLETTITEKLRLYVKSKLLEEGIGVRETNSIIKEIDSTIVDLASKIVSGEITQKDAEEKLDSIVSERISKPKKKELIKTLENEYLAHLRERGVINVRQVLEAVKEDIEALVDEVIEGRMDIDKALEAVVTIPLPKIAIFKETKEEVPERKEEVPERKVITIRTDADILRFLRKEWPCIVTKGVIDCLEEYGVKVPLTLPDRFARVAKSILYGKVPKSVREWFLTGYNPVYYDVLRMLFTFGVDSEKFKKWFKGVYETYKPILEEKTNLELPDFQEFYDMFREFLINYRL